MATKEKRLFRSEKDKVFFGVCGGLSEYFEVDPVITRVIFVLLAIAGSFGFWLYVILALVLPSESENVDSEERLRKFANEAKERMQSVGQDIEIDRNAKKIKNIVGLFLVVIGIVILLNQFFSLHWLEDALLPAGIILLGLYILFRKR